MSTVFLILFGISLAAVVISLFGGLLFMGKNSRRSNVLMRARIISQACVIVFFILYMVAR